MSCCECEEDNTTPAGRSDEPLVDPFSDPNNLVKVPFEKIALAYVTMREGLVKTKCALSHLSLITGMNIYTKHEFTQFTGSFKERGTRFTMLQMTDEERKRGVVASSTGNHAQAVSYHGLLLGISVTVVMPEVAPLMKVQKCKELKANVIVQGKDIIEAKYVAMQIAKDTGAYMINGYDHPNVIAGAGTLGIEILDQVPDVDAVIIPVGGGGMLSGTSIAIKYLKPSVQVIGVEPESCATFAAAMKAGHPVETEMKSTLADGLAVAIVGYNAVHNALDNVDRMIQVKEEDIAVALLRLAEMQKFVVEGAGAVGVAAALAGQLDEFTGKNVVIILSGGNIDTTVLNRALDRGMAADGRLVEAFIRVPDRPGNLAELCNLISSTGATIRKIDQERAWINVDVFTVEIRLVLQTRNYEHVKELEKLLAQNYKNSRFVCVDFPASSSTRWKFKLPVFK